MVGCELMYQVNEALCAAKGRQEPFGGISIIFAGDFAQLPPVKQVRLYAHVLGKNGRWLASPHGQKVVFGRLLWLQIDKVVLLSQVMRQAGPAEQTFVALLSRLRMGKYADLSSLAWKDAPIIVSDNTVKDVLNLAAAKAFARNTGQDFHVYHAHD
ncbi:hypothetical protein CALVIDRAFT_462195, partial [Calocera viscosa TUFC12733]